MPLDDETKEARVAFGSALRQARTEAGLSLGQVQQELVRRGISITATQVGNWESGRNAPSRTELRIVEALLGRPGLGLIMGLDAGLLANHEDRIAALEERSTEDAIRADTRLDEERRVLLLEAYNLAVRQSRPASDGAAASSRPPTSARRARR